jgi:ADP-ribosylglycohydrolase
MDESIGSLREHYQFNETCQGSVPQAIIAFLESDHFEDAIRKAVSIGGDSDTIACIAGGIAHAYYKQIPDPIVDQVYRVLDSRLRRIVTLFCNKYSCH